MLWSYSITNLFGPKVIAQLFELFCKNFNLVICTIVFRGKPESLHLKWSSVMGFGLERKHETNL